MDTQSSHPKRTFPLFLRVTAWITLLLFFLVCIALALTMRYSLYTFQEKIDGILRSTVLTLSESQSVHLAIRSGQCPPELASYLDSVVAYTEDLDYITIADANSIRVYHIDPTFIGLPFEGGDQGPALQGKSYLSDAEAETFGLQHRAFAPVQDADGSVIGFVMASTSQERIDDLRNHIYATYIHLFLILTGFGLLISAATAAYLSRTFRGARPEDLVRIYLTQNEVLNGLDEGLISLDDQGKIRLVNRAAADALDSPEERLYNVHVDNLLHTDKGGSLWGIQGDNLPTDRSEILVSSVQIPNSSGWSRQVLILKDKGELLHQAEQLNGTRHIITALRANTHEFLNKLQVISGLLQMGDTQEALAYIGSLSATNTRVVQPVMKLIHNPNVAALILGKMSNMRELDIIPTLLTNSSLPEHSLYLSTDELVTVIGNLLENAIEAVNAMPPNALRAVTLQITEDAHGLIIVVSDSGTGIAEDMVSQIFDYDFSTKAQEGRGVGMALIQSIVERHGGSIEIDTEPGSGSIFTLIFNQPRGGIT